MSESPGHSEGPQLARLLRGFAPHSDEENVSLRAKRGNPSPLTGED